MNEIIQKMNPVRVFIGLRLNRLPKPLCKHIVLISYANDYFKYACRAGVEWIFNYQIHMAIDRDDIDMFKCLMKIKKPIGVDFDEYQWIARKKGSTKIYELIWSFQN